VDTQQTQLAAILAAAPIIPVITIERADDAVPLARTLLGAGLSTLEITLRTAAAPTAIAAIAREVPEAIIGVGTVLNRGDLEHARNLGAHFALSPGATDDLLAAAAASTLPLIPGVQTASEVMAAVARGFTFLKYFPAAVGGPPALRALAGPFPHVRFCPTGGIDEATLALWLALPNVVAVGGSWLTPAAEVRAGNWAAIAERVRRTLAARYASVAAPAAAVDRRGAKPQGSNVQP
jgi:2-dehydro-3-deoxyphosphogluconate aldolase/(4S)-4-hydroxy-2-oxoglutarate aldolase